LFLRYYFFFKYTPHTDPYPLSLHDALPIFQPAGSIARRSAETDEGDRPFPRRDELPQPMLGGPRHLFSPVRADLDSATWSTARSDRKSTRLNSSHVAISYAVFCLKKKKTTK